MTSEHRKCKMINVKFLITFETYEVYRTKKLKRPVITPYDFRRMNSKKKATTETNTYHCNPYYSIANNFSKSVTNTAPPVNLAHKPAPVSNHPNPPKKLTRLSSTVYKSLAPNHFLLLDAKDCNKQKKKKHLTHKHKKRKSNLRFPLNICHINHTVCICILQQQQCSVTVFLQTRPVQSGVFVFITNCHIHLMF